MASEPLIPYLVLPDLTLVPEGVVGGVPPFPITIKPFGALIALGIYIATYFGLRHGARLGLDRGRLLSFVMWVIGSGFVFGHVLDVVFYFPDRVRSDPLSLLRLWEGLSSYGGFVGALVGGLLWKWRHRTEILPYADITAASFPIGWLFGRAGCAVVHDHPGARSDLWFAVQYPDGGRFDLGLYEAVLTVPLVIAVVVLRRRARPLGFFLAVITLSYAPVRFALDFLRSTDLVGSDPRYGGLTPAQWASFALSGAGLVMLGRVLRGAPALGSGANPETSGNDASG